MVAALAVLLFAAFAALYWLALLRPFDGRIGLRSAGGDPHQLGASEGTWTAGSPFEQGLTVLDLATARRRAGESATTPTEKRLPEAA